MAKGGIKCVYKPDSQSTDEYIVLVEDTAALKKWQDGDKTIPLAEIVDSFDVFHTGQGSQGVLGRTSKQILESVFSTSHEDEVVKIILEKGEIKGADHTSEKSSTKNDSRSGQYQSSFGSGGTGGR